MNQNRNVITLSLHQVAVMGAKGAVSILYRGQSDVAKYEKEYIDKFGNPFPAAVRGMLISLISFL